MIRNVHYSSTGESINNEGSRKKDLGEELKSTHSKEWSFIPLRITNTIRDAGGPHARTETLQV